MNIDPRAGRPVPQGRTISEGPAPDPGGACPACGGRLAPTRVRTALWEGEALAVVQDVPAMVCRSCHERYFDDDTVTRLDLMRAGGFASETAVTEWRVPVYAFPAAGRDRP